MWTTRVPRKIRDIESSKKSVEYSGILRIQDKDIPMQTEYVAHPANSPSRHQVIEK
jgi:hypothetical protein